MTLLWLDLETTGTDPQKDHILEVAWTITDSQLQGHNGAVNSYVIEVGSEAFYRLKDNDFVTAMHKKTGLYDELVEDAVLGLDVVEAMILRDMAEWEATHTKEDGPWFLAGASVHFDLGFLRANTPSLAAQLSHRVYDTSTLKAFMHEFLDVKITNAAPHRAAADVQEVLSYAQTIRGAMVDAKNIISDLGFAEGAPIF